MREEYSEWARRVYRGTEFENIEKEVDKIRAVRFEKREKQRSKKILQRIYNKIPFAYRNTKKTLQSLNH